MLCSVIITLHHSSLVEADVLRHPRPTVTSTHTLREVDAIKAQLSSVTQSQRQHKEQADKMMETFLQQSQAQLDGIRVSIPQPNRCNQHTQHTNRSSTSDLAFNTLLVA